MTCVVYRLYDEAGELLYVGCTSRLEGRMVDHATTKDWWPQVVRTEVEHFDDRDEALRREGNLILEHKPPHNLMVITGRGDGNPVADANLRAAKVAYDEAIEARKEAHRAFVEVVRRERQSRSLADIAKELGVSKQRVEQISKGR